MAIAIGLGLRPVYQFVGSMIWFREYLGDYQVFWGISRLPVDRIYGYRVFAYPPSALLLIRPFGWLPFWQSLATWTIVGLALLYLAARRIIRANAFVVGFMTYAVTGVVVGGQISLFMGALVLGGLSAQDPRWRGVLFAAASVIKPQSVLAAPVALIAERNWGSIGWAMAAGSTFLLLSVLLFGLDPWLSWAREMPKFRPSRNRSHGRRPVRTGRHAGSVRLDLPCRCPSRHRDKLVCVPDGDADSGPIRCFRRLDRADVAIHAILRPSRPDLRVRSDVAGQDPLAADLVCIGADRQLGLRLSRHRAACVDPEL